MRRTLYRLARGLSLFSYVLGVEGGASAIALEVMIKQDISKSELDMPSQTVGGQIQVAQEDNAVPICPISGPRGVWDQYQMHDLPRGHCSGPQACTLWTR